MARNEKTSIRLAAIAGRVLNNPETATTKDIVALAACVLTQVADKNLSTQQPKIKRKRKMAKKGTPKTASSMKGGKKGSKKGSKSC